MTVEPLDPADPVAMQAWHDTYYAADTFGREWAVPYQLAERRAELLARGTGELTFPFRGLVDDEVVSTGVIVLPQRDNLHLAWVQVHTHPEHRRRGHGSTMLAHLSEVARKHERRTLTAEVSYPYDGPPDGADHPDVRFATDRGFRLGLGDVMRVLDLPADESMLRAMVLEAAAHHGDYGLRQFSGAVPEDILDSFAELVGSLITEAPVGELEVEPEVFDATRIRADEQMFAASQRLKYTTVAVTPDGTVAAYSELVVPELDPGRVYQWGTLAHRDHRGHRLGIATKARNLLWLQSERPGAALLFTYNAEVNRHMIGVNEQMGFRPVERMGEFEQKLD